MTTGHAATTGDQTDFVATRLAEEIRRRRNDANVSHAELAGRIGYSRQYVSRAERPRKGLPSADLVRAIDHALRADGALVALRQEALSAYRARRSDTRGIAVTSVSIPARRPENGAPGIESMSGAYADGEVVVAAPAGRFFAGSTIPARAYPAIDDGRILAAVPPGFVDDPFLRRPRRGLVVGVIDDTDGGPQLFGLDTRHARRRLTGAAGESRLLVSPAYVLDDLTFGLLWAVACLDEPLLDDDIDLTASGEHLEAYERLSRSAGGHEFSGDLAPVSRMWLGSSFCARHILRHRHALTDVPTFWTREQRGEEASTWLFFAHKFAYLRESVAAFTGSNAFPTRVFCVPQSAVSASSRPERILLLLTMALMESFNVRVDVCDEPEYTSMQGFVLDQCGHAIVVNWIGAEGIWQVDVTDSRPRLHEFADAASHSRSYSVASAPTPVGRLRALADYLELDWSWLVRRCRALADYGCAGIAQPRSRLLSVDGVDRACRFLGQSHEKAH